MEYSRHSLEIKDQYDVHQVLRTISSLQDLVVIHIADPAEMKPILLSEENLRAVLNKIPESLFVEALPLGSFKKLMRDQIEPAVEATLALRSTLRKNYVGEVAPQIRDFFTQLDPILSMLKCYALQNAQSGVPDIVRKLHDQLEQLAASSFEHADNVRSMDDLHFQILPILKKILRVFKK